MKKVSSLREESGVQSFRSLIAVFIAMSFVGGTLFVVPGTGSDTTGGIVPSATPSTDLSSGPADPEGNPASDDPITPSGWVEPDGDFIISYEDGAIEDAMAPSIYTTPFNARTKDSGMAGSIHAVWSEYNPESKVNEIYYSMTEPGMAGYPLSWTGEKADRIVSEVILAPSGIGPFGDAMNASVVVDDFGTIHVVWAQEYLDWDKQIPAGWQVHYAFSKDNGRTWSSDPDQQPGRDIVISFGGSSPDSITAPKLTRGKDNDELVADPLYTVWAENYGNEQQEVYFSHSLDGGATWSGVENRPPISTLDGTKAFSPSVGATGPAGEIVHVAWKQYLDGLPENGDEIYYVSSADNGLKWTTEVPITNPGDRFDIGHVEMETSVSEAFIVWNQTARDGSTAGVYYSASFDDGGTWKDTELPISYYDPVNDPNPPLAPSVGVTYPVEGEPLEVQVSWTEFDDKVGTYEVHHSMNSDPTNPDAWTGLKGDNIISWPDGKEGIDAKNVQMSMGYVNGVWRPQIVWDEPNYKGGGTRAQDNREIHYYPEEVTLTTSSSPSIGGSVSRDTAPPYYLGDTVTLTASPNVGWYFDYWTGDALGSTNPLTITMDDNKSITAVFTEYQYTLGVTISPASTGTVDKSPDQATYTYGTTVWLTASPNSGYEFDRWEGDATGTANPVSVYMDGNKSVTAYFRPVFDIPVHSGWNFISVPRVQSDTTITVVLDDSKGDGNTTWDEVRWYDPNDPQDHWKSHNKNFGGTQELLNINRTMGFWIYITNVGGGYLTVAGQYPSSTTIGLTAGWNMAGYPAQDDSTYTVADLKSDTGATMVQGYNASAPYDIQTLGDSYVLKRGEAYWIKMGSAGTWIINW